MSVVFPNHYNKRKGAFTLHEDRPMVLSKKIMLIIE